MMNSPRKGNMSYFDPEYGKEIQKVLNEPWQKSRPRKNRVRHCYKKK